MERNKIIYGKFESDFFVLGTEVALKTLIFKRNETL